MSSVSANLVLTARKALSLCLSVWWFGDGWNAGMSIGTSLVFFGSILYALGGQVKTHAVENRKGFEREMRVEVVDDQRGKQQVNGDGGSMQAERLAGGVAANIWKPLRAHTSESRKDT